MLTTSAIIRSYIKGKFTNRLVFGSLLTGLVLCVGACDSSTTVDKVAPKTTPTKVDTVRGLNNKTATIATGGASGSYNAIGIALANAHNNTYNAKLKTQATGASVENLTLIEQGKVDMAFAMSDVITEAVLGQRNFLNPSENIQQIATLYPNYVQIVTSKKSGIKDFEDLKGKRIAVGAKNSGVEANARELFAGFDMSYEDVDVEYLGYDEAADALKAGNLDAAFLTSGLPNSALMSLSKKFDLQLVSIDPDKIADLAKDKTYFVAKYIPAGMYGDKNAIPTAAVMNAYVVNAKMTEDDVYKITKTLFDNVDRLRSAHPAAATITPESAQQNMIAPIHPGAQKYYDQLAAR